PAAAVEHSHSMSFREWRFRFYINGLATEYARRRCRVDMPWESEETVGGIVRGRAGAFLRLARTLVAQREMRALVRLPSYALARTVWYTRGVRDGGRRYGGAAA